MSSKGLKLYIWWASAQICPEEMKCLQLPNVLECSGKS